MRVEREVVVLTFQWPQGLCLTLQVMIVGVGKIFIKCSRAVLQHNITHNPSDNRNSH